MARQPRASKATAAATATETKDNQAMNAPAHATKVKAPAATEVAAPAKKEYTPFADSIAAVAKDVMAFNLKQYRTAIITPEKDSDLCEYAGASGKITVIVFQMDTKNYIAAREYKGETFWSWNDAKESNFYGSARGAVVSTVSRIKGFKSAMVKDVAIDEFAKLNSEGAVTVDPWEADATMLDDAKAANVAIDALIENKKEARVKWLALGAILGTAYNKCRASSGGIDNQAWKKYRDQFFPQIATLGKNAASEAVFLGTAPAGVIEAWPADQSSAKSFQGWHDTIRAGIGNIVVGLVMENHRPALAAWKEDAGATEATKPVAPVLAEIVDCVRGALAGELSAQYDAAKAKADATVGADGKRIGDAEHAANQDAFASVNAQAQVGAWFIEKVDALSAEDIEAGTLPLVKFLAGLVEKVAGKFAEYKTAAVDAAQEAAATSAAVEAIAQKFADMSADDATAHLLNILVSHAEASDILAQLNVQLPALLAKRDAAQAVVEEKAEGDADAEIDGQ